MSISAKIILDSINSQGIRLTTMLVRMPKFILPEFGTHRVFSRNTSSSRAIPTQKLIEDIKKDPAIPVRFGKNQKGMQASEDISEEEKQRALGIWNYDRETGIWCAEELLKLNVHKQVTNRLIENHSHVNVLVSATNWANFYRLRNHPDAQPDIQVVAVAMYEAQMESEPAQLKKGNWHLPYITGLDRQVCYDNHDLIKISVARCARTSYLNTEGKVPTLQEDMALYNRLVGSDPIHASPAEHQATPTGDTDYCGNFKGWIQWRKFLENEFIEG